jgi:hypothetical protein
LDRFKWWWFWYSKWITYDGTVVGVQTTIAISYPNLDGGSVYNIISAIGNVDGGFPESFYSLEAAYDGGIV